jgi:SAM-dependent methyltransferase
VTSHPSDDRVRFAPRPPTRLDRPPLAPDEVEKIRRERLEPRPTQWDYLHLHGLRRELAAALGSLPDLNGPVLDLFCGAKPYAELIPRRPVWGMDLDRHFRGADVIATIPLPFRDGAFAVVLCSQALHLVDDPVVTVGEMARVLAPNGHAVVTIPHLFIGEGNLERHWSKRDVRRLFAGWRGVSVRGIDGPGVALAFVAGRTAMLAARRSRIARALYPVFVRVLNAVCAPIDTLLRPLHGRWPHSLIVVAQPPTPTGTR